MSLPPMQPGELVLQAYAAVLGLIQTLGMQTWVPALVHQVLCHGAISLVMSAFSMRSHAANSCFIFTILLLYIAIQFRFVTILKQFCTE